jgi:hypothetical protein
MKLLDSRFSLEQQSSLPKRGSVSMATVAPVYEERRMSITRVFQRAFQAISLNPVVILSLALVVGAVPSLLMTALIYRAGIGSPASIQNGSISFGAIIGASFISGIVGLVVSALVQGAITRATVTAIEGRRATFGESLSTALRVLLPLIGLSILLAIGIMIGFVLLIVPGIILLLMWAVAVPSLVIERGGVFAAFARSAELTSGARLRILGLFLLLAVIYWLLSLAAGIVGLGLYSPTAASTGFTVTNIIGGIVVGTVFNMMWGTVQPSLYIELRQWKEGGSIENLEQIFA